MPNSGFNGQNTASSHNGAARSAVLMTPANINLKDRSQAQSFVTPFYKVQKQAKQICALGIWGVITLGENLGSGRE